MANAKTKKKPHASNAFALAGGDVLHVGDVVYCENNRPMVVPNEKLGVVAAIFAKKVRLDDGTEYDSWGRKVPKDDPIFGWRLQKATEEDKRDFLFRKALRRASHLAAMTNERLARVEKAKGSAAPKAVQDLVEAFAVAAARLLEAL